MIITLMVVLGLSLGSFVNALVWRIHQQSLPKKKRFAKNADLSIATGRSMCTHCGHTLAWYDLLPVISWVSLLGKCRYCNRSIGWQYPLIEMVTAMLFVVSYVSWPYDLVDAASIAVLIAWLLSIVMFMALLVYDLRWMLLPDRIVYPLTIVAFGVSVVGVAQGVTSIISVFSSVLIASGIFYLLFQISSGKWIGGGDVKLGLSLGLLLGAPLLAFMMLFFASIIGLLLSGAMVAARRGAASKVISFGPCLILATVIVKLYGMMILDWYNSAFLYV